MVNIAHTAHGNIASGWNPWSVQIDSSVAQVRTLHSGQRGGVNVSLKPSVRRGSERSISSSIRSGMRTSIHVRGGSNIGVERSCDFEVLI